MSKKRLVFPWEISHTITCQICGEKIVTQPLWHWEKPDTKINELQPFFCHKIDSTLTKEIPVLTENDWTAHQRLIEFSKELRDEKDQVKSAEDIERLFSAEKGPSEVFLKHGIFPLIFSFTKTELKALFLLLCLEPGYSVRQVFFMEEMQVSRTYASMIIKKFTKEKFVTGHRAPTKGRARGRQLTYAFDGEVRARLDKDLSDFDFFRNEIKKTVRPIALCFNEKPWRKDLGLLDRET
jgi:hypothetical protein